jgi:hypothetical protein
MTRVAASILLAVQLGGGFGNASASILSSTPESMVVEVEVEVEVEADSVVAHFALPGEEQVTIPLLPRDGGRYGVTTELKPADYQVVFEALGETSAQSDPVSLSDLGADVDSIVGEPGDEGDEQSPSTNRWMWLGIALGAASLSALAFWVLGERDDKDDDHEPPQASSEEPAPETSPEPSSAEEITSDS